MLTTHMLDNAKKQLDSPLSHIHFTSPPVLSRNHPRDYTQHFRLGLPQENILTLFDILGMTQELENHLCPISCPDQPGWMVQG
jgi:hypothetical protein